MSDVDQKQNMCCNNSMSGVELDIDLLGFLLNKSPNQLSLLQTSSTVEIFDWASFEAQ